MPLDFDLQMARLEVKLLREQFSSHFLFNHFNAINHSILKDDPKAASSYLTLFARLLRRITADSQREFVRLSEEIETIKLYIKIESMRYGVPLRFVTHFEAGLDPSHVWIPTLILHAYVENAIWHVLQQRHEEGVICVELIRKNAKYHLLLKDNGKGQQKRFTDQMKSQGQTEIELTGERLQLLNRQYGTDIRITLENSEISGEVPAPQPAKRCSSRAGRTVNISFHPFSI